MHLGSLFSEGFLSIINSVEAIDRSNEREISFRPFFGQEKRKKLKFCNLNEAENSKTSADGSEFFNIGNT